MNIDSAVRKLVGISEMKIKDSKVRRLFIVANGSKTFRELFDLCGFDEKEGISLAQMLLDEGCLASSGNSYAVSPTALASRDGFVFTVELIEVLIAEMATYVGPIAALLVQGMASLNQVVSPTDLDQILVSLADKIEDSEKRAEFLTTIRADFEQ
ncbi:MAG: hypothetical protein OCC45_15835 [Desulfotalea sp.]